MGRNITHIQQKIRWGYGELTTFEAFLRNITSVQDRINLIGNGSKCKCYTSSGSGSFQSSLELLQPHEALLALAKYEYGEAKRDAQQQDNSKSVSEFIKAFATIDVTPVKQVVQEAEGFLKTKEDEADRRNKEREANLIQEARSKYSRSLYSEYLVIYPQGSYVNEANEAINRFKEDDLITLAKKEVSHHRYQEYLHAYPHGRYVEEAQKEIDRIQSNEEAFFRDICRTNSIEGYEEFLKLYPLSHFVEEARKKMVFLIQNKEKVDAVISTNEIKNHLDFLKNNPNSPYVDKVKSNLIAIVEKKLDLLNYSYGDFFQMIKDARVVQLPDVKLFIIVSTVDKLEKDFAHSYPTWVEPVREATSFVTGALQQEDIVNRSYSFADLRNEMIRISNRGNGLDRDIRTYGETEGRRVDRLQTLASFQDYLAILKEAFTKPTT